MSTTPTLPEAPPPQTSSSPAPSNGAPQQTPSAPPSNPVAEAARALAQARWQAQQTQQASAPAEAASAPVEGAGAQTAEAAAPTEAPVAPPELFSKRTLEDGRIEYVLNTGERYVGTPDELLDKLADSSAKTHQYGRQLKTELDKYRTPNQGAQANQQQANQTQASDTPQIDPAVQQVIDLLAPGFGMQSGQELIQTFQQMRQQQEQIQAQSVAQQFLQLAPDFPRTPANVEAIDRHMLQNGIPYTPQNLHMAYLYLKSTNALDPATTAPPQPPAPGYQRVQPPPPPPSAGVSPSTQTKPFSEADAYSIPLDQLSQMIHSNRRPQ